MTRTPRLRWRELLPEQLLLPIQHLRVVPGTLGMEEDMVKNSHFDSEFSFEVPFEA